MKNDKQINQNDMPIIYSYSRAEAIEDGVLADISSLAREAGFKFPVAVTSRLFELLNDTTQLGQSFEGRAWDLLMILRFAIRKSSGTDTIYFAPLFNTKDHREPKPYKLWSKCGPGDEGDPVISIMFQDED